MISKVPKFFRMGCTRNVRGGLGNSSASLQDLGDTFHCRATLSANVRLRREGFTTHQKDRGMQQRLPKQSHTSKRPFIFASPLPAAPEEDERNPCHTFCDSVEMGASIII